MRLDQYLVHHNHAPSRAKAQEFISEGCVTVNESVITKKNYKVKEADKVVCKPLYEFVSRAALKLEHALERWPLFKAYIQDSICLDVGASTGGFTDILLHYNANFVVSVDVGKDQMHPKLRHHAKVACIEQMDAREINKIMMQNILSQHEKKGLIQTLVGDLSFVSLFKILFPLSFSLRDSIAKDAQAVFLLKPQFELSPRVMRQCGGVVNSPALLHQVCDDAKHQINDNGFWHLRSIEPSPIKGGDGNQEFLLYLERA